MSPAPRPGPKISWPLANEMEVVRCVRGRPWDGAELDGPGIRVVRVVELTCERSAVEPELARNQPGEVTASVRADEPSRAANFISILLEKPRLSASLGAAASRSGHPTNRQCAPVTRPLYAPNP